MQTTNETKNKRRFGFNFWNRGRGLKALKFVAFLILIAALLIIIKNEVSRQFYPSSDDKDTSTGLSNPTEEKFTKVVFRAVHVPAATDGTIGKESLAKAAQSEQKANQDQETNYYDSFYLDENGIVVITRDVSISDTESLPLLVISESQDIPIESGMEIMAKEEVDYIIEIYKTIEKSPSNFSISYVIYNPKVKEELAVVTEEGWEIYLNTNLTVDAQISKLELALAEKIKENRKNLLYVDLRVKDRVYYKSKD